MNTALIQHTSHVEVADEVLVARTTAGDTKAFDELVRRHSGAFHRVARGVVKQEAEAQDVVQTAFMNMFRKLHTFQPGASFQSWAYRVVMNAALMWLRKRKTRSEMGFGGSPDHGALAQRMSRADRQMERRELARVLHEAVEALAPKYRIVFALREYEQLTLQEIGDHLGLSMSAVKSRLHRARHVLRVSLRAYRQA